MPRIVEAPARIPGVGGKTIEEFFGRANSATEAVSIARMVAPPGWVEPGQTPEFDEYTLVLRGSLAVDSHDGSREIAAGQAVLVPRGEWVRYRAGSEGAEYIAVCLPAFSPETVHRDATPPPATPRKPAP